MNQPPPGSVPQTKLYLEGRYRKLVRDLPQTVFYCPECKGHPRRRKKCQRCEGFGKLTRDSVQELVAWVATKEFGTRKQKFHGAGREDIDVRMLGRGRPFVLELANARNTDIDLAELEAEINRRNEGRIEIEGLHYAAKERVVILKETPHAKAYQALVELESAIELSAFDEHLNKRIVVAQKTPDRVAHRRADLTRERWIELTAVEAVEGSEGRRFLITLNTQHGTYVKEVLSGEGGKTDPSLTGLLGVPSRCVELDVLNILEAEGAAPAKPRERPPSFGSGLA